MKLDMNMIAIYTAVQAAFPKAQIDKLVAESQLAAEASAEGKEASEATKEQKFSLLSTIREVAGTVLQHKDWNRTYFDAAIALAVQSGANEDSITAYSSTVGSYLEATQRKENPLPPEPLLDTENVKYADLREMLKTPEAKRMAQTRKEIAGYVAELNQTELDQYATELRELTQERRDSKEAKKAEAAAKKLAKAATQPGPVVEVQAEPQQAQRAA